MRVTGLFVAATALVAGCARDSVGTCPDMAVGDLVVTEFRGPQSDMADTGGVWVEMYNSSSGTLDLEGMKIRFRTKDGSSEIDVLVRRSVTVAAGGYVVLGMMSDSDRPSFVDYGFGDDFAAQMKKEFLAAAATDVEACGTRIDRAVYDLLPKVGTYSFGGTPTPDNNDMPTMWCTNATPAGTPQQPNPPCP